jgi:uncharacterized protein
MRALFDVNLLLALFDRKHMHHTAARLWWSQNSAHGWASCPLTENGFLRIVTQPKYANPLLLPDALLIFRQWAKPPRHVFWTDDLSIHDLAAFDTNHMLSARNLTDIYLLALAVKNEGTLVTFDRHISLKAVRGAEPKNLTVLKALA